MRFSKTLKRNGWNVGFSPDRHLRSLIGRAGARVGSVTLPVCLLLGGVALLAWGLSWVVLRADDSGSGKSDQESVSESRVVDRPLFPVAIRKPNGPPAVHTGMTDVSGNPVTVSCGTCHANRAANFANRTAADMNEFHGNLTLAHGSISCLSCHNSEDYDSLKLADGSRVEFSEVMTLCAQCHGAQMRDYENGVHGGMNGYWDLTRGSRTRNNCVDCHFPHMPQFPKMQPTFKPKDRFLH